MSKLDKLWEQIYEEIRKSTTLDYKGHRLVEGRDFDIVDFVHSHDMAALTYQGKVCFKDKVRLVFKITPDGQDGIRIQRTEEQLPEGIRIGKKIFTLRRGPVEDDALGKCNHIIQEIFVADSTDPDQERQTFIHEIVHAVIKTHCPTLHLPRNVEERFVNEFAKGMLEAIKANPQYFTPPVCKAPYIPVEMETITFDESEEDIINAGECDL